MEFNITFAQAKTHVDEFISFMQSPGYKESTQKIAAQNIRYFLNSTAEGTKQLTEDSIYEFVVKHYDRTRQRSRFNSVLGSCRRFLSYLYWVTLAWLDPHQNHSMCQNNLKYA